MASVLSEASKFRLSLIVAHQYLAQVNDETADAVWGNVGSMVSFQVGSDDAEALRMQVPTLEANAEIETRQQLEAQIMALVKHGRYIEATALAKRVIEQYPDSPQAEALRRQIDRLEELATNPDAPPARVRID